MFYTPFKALIDAYNILAIFHDTKYKKIMYHTNTKLKILCHKWNAALVFLQKQFYK